MPKARTQQISLYTLLDSPAVHMCHGVERVTNGRCTTGWMGRVTGGSIGLLGYVQGLSCLRHSTMQTDRDEGRPVGAVHAIGTLKTPARGSSAREGAWQVLSGDGAREHSRQACLRRPRLTYLLSSPTHTKLPTVHVRASELVMPGGPAGPQEPGNLHRPLSRRA